MIHAIDTTYKIVSQTQSITCYEELDNDLNEEYVNGTSDITTPARFSSNELSDCK